MIDQNEIVFCNAKFKVDKKEYKLNQIVHKHTDGFFYDKKILNEFKVSEPVELFDIEIISRLGFANKNI